MIEIRYDPYRKEFRAKTENGPAGITSTKLTDLFARLGAFHPDQSIRFIGVDGGHCQWPDFRSGASGEADAILPVKDRPR